MKRSRGRFATAFSIIAYSVIAFAVCTTKPTEGATGRSINFSSAGEEISRYKTWTRVNREPVMMERIVAVSCARPAPAQELNLYGPHKDKFVVVYVNDTGQHAMMFEQSPIFPQGSIIVKEKLPAKESLTPELLTAMIKREKGYDPQNGDWEYLVLDGSGTKIQERGKMKSCQSCHTAYKKTDFVIRNYFSPEPSERPR